MDRDTPTDRGFRTIIAESASIALDRIHRFQRILHHRSPVAAVSPPSPNDLNRETGSDYEEEYRRFANLGLHRIRAFHPLKWGAQTAFGRQAMVSMIAFRGVLECSFGGFSRVMTSIEVFGNRTTVFLLIL